MVSYYMVGIKGTGMASLSVLLSEMGGLVRGCDTAEVFSTDALLAQNHIFADVGFEAANLPLETDVVIFSTAYLPSTPILAEATRRGKEMYSYVEFLAKLTKERDSYVVCGTHGKTTVTAATSFLLSQGKRTSYPFFSVFGSNLVGRARMFCQGKEYFLLEGCEYQDHFLRYRTRGALVTAVEWDHPDYFKDEKAVYESFLKFCSGIEKGGFCVICVDGTQTRHLASSLAKKRADIRIIPYGFSHRGPLRIRPFVGGGYTVDLIEMPYHFPVSSQAWVDDFVGAAILATAMLLDAKDVKLYLPENSLVTDEAFPSVLSSMLSDLAGYPGTIGRMEVTGEEGEITYIDDYAHHPTQIRVVLESLRLTYRNRHILVVFRPHTVSRTTALFSEFVTALSFADKLIIQNTYASARGDGDVQGNSSENLAKALQERMLTHYHIPLQAVIFAKDDEEAIEIANSWLLPGDLCVTMGAGNNRHLADSIRDRRRKG